VGSTAITNPNTTFSRNLTLNGSGGIDVALHPIIWSGAISGSGQLIKSGSGVLQLTGANTYKGGTLVRDGVLWVTSDAQLGFAGTGVTLNGGTFRSSEDFATSRPFTLIDTPTSSRPSFTVDGSKTLTLNGVVSGGVLTKADRGTLVLKGANTYSNTVIQGGTVVGNASSIRGNVTFKVVEGPPSVNFDQTTTGTFAGAITGPGSLVKTGAGELTLTARNNYSGGTTVQAGTLVGNSDSCRARSPTAAPSSSTKGRLGPTPAPSPAPDR
jgi:autotransporter-associated beta strand protein